MIGGILAAICLAFLMTLTVFAAGACSLGDAIVGGFCESEHDQRTLSASCDRTIEGHNCETNPTCCFGCTATGKCTGAGCEWVDSYIQVTCSCVCEEKNQLSCNDNDRTGCVCPNKEFNDPAFVTYFPTEAQCDTAKSAGGADFGGGGWTCTSSLQPAACTTGDAGETFDDANAACNKAVGTYTDAAADGLVDCKALKSQTASGQTWLNTGCESDGIVATADTGEEEADGSHYCEYSGIASFLVFLHLGVVIAISVGGCCVVCCGKGPDDGDDDDGKSDE
jgi:hypothetical protein